MAVFKRPFTEEELKALSEEDMKEVSGGYTFYADQEQHGFEVIDDKTGNVVQGGFTSIFKAQKRAEELGLSTLQLSRDQLYALRKAYLYGHEWQP